MRRPWRAVLIPVAFGTLLSTQGSALANPLGGGSQRAAATVAVKEFKGDVEYPTAGQTGTFTAKLVADRAITVDELVFAVRDSSDARLDFGHRTNVQLGTTAQTFTASRSFPAGTFKIWMAYRQGTTWTNLAPSPAQTFTATKSSSGGENPPTGVQPQGGGTGWNVKWWDEFNGTSVDWGTKWRGNSSSLVDNGRGNKDNQQLEYNLDRNCQERDGAVTITAKRESYTSPSGTGYGWTSCLLTSTGSSGYTFKHAFIESRAKLTYNVKDANGKPVSDKRGFWPAFWTWQADGVNSWQETDAYEQYSDNPRKLYLTSHAGSGGGCQPTLEFDPGDGFHTYGADISPSGTRFYIDGQLVCTVAGTPSEKTNIIEDLYVYSSPGHEPNPATVSAQKSVDYVRVWQR
ncbi:family 16 glycosylhydrolase [Streptomyces sp. NPDC059590]|uniref:glycoside hydrolase family 16 protein n=1 Tax=Streptomyces sp. NPDC059590 TaxID=3346877 RepID=UPI00367A6BA4